MLYCTKASTGRILLPIKTGGALRTSCAVSAMDLLAFAWDAVAAKKAALPAGSLAAAG